MIDRFTNDSILVHGGAPGNACPIQPPSSALLAVSTLAWNDLAGEMALAAQRVGHQAREFGLFEQFLRAFGIRSLRHMEFGVRVEAGEAHLAVDAVQGALGPC